RVAADEDDERAEPRGARLLHELEGALGVAGEDACGQPAESRRHGPLAPGLGLDCREDELLAALGERPGGGWKALALGQRAVERGEALAGELEARSEVVAVAGRGSRGALRLVGGSSELVGRDGALLLGFGAGKLAGRLGPEPCRRFLEEPD